MILGLILGQEGIQWAHIPPIGWTALIFLVTNIFMAGVNYRRMEQFEKDQRRFWQEHEKLVGRVSDHEDDRDKHCLDGPAERSMLREHERELARLTMRRDRHPGT